MFLIQPFVERFHKHHTVKMYREHGSVVTQPIRFGSRLGCHVLVPAEAEQGSCGRRTESDTSKQKQKIIAPDSYWIPDRRTLSATELSLFKAKCSVRSTLFNLLTTGIVIVIVTDRSCFNSRLLCMVNSAVFVGYYSLAPPDFMVMPSTQQQLLQEQTYSLCPLN